MNVVNGTKRQAVPVGHQFMRQIRIGVHQFPQAKVRLVLDLGRTVPFIIEKTGAQLRVTLSEQALAVQAPQGTQTVTRSVPGPAEVGAGGASAGPPPATNVASMTPRRSVPVPVPERLKFLDPLTSLAQPRPDQPTDIGGLRGPQTFNGKRNSLGIPDGKISSGLRLIGDGNGLHMVVRGGGKYKVK